MACKALHFHNPKRAAAYRIHNGSVGGDTDGASGMERLFMMRV